MKIKSLTIFIDLIDLYISNAYREILEQKKTNEDGIFFKFSVEDFYLQNTIFCQNIINIIN